MTALEPETLSEQHPEPAERPVLRREFAAEFTEGDGRTVEMRIVPYGERIQHNDGLGGVPEGVVYSEEWLPGVFDHQLNAAHRVHANVEHEQGISGKVGHGLTLRSAPDGFYGTFRLLDTPAGETARQLIHAGSLDGVSLEARPVKNIRGADGVVKRVKAHLHAIAFTRFAAYSGARVLALREEAETTLDEALLPVEPDPEMIERCRRLGIKLPQRYQEAHPDEADTPAETGTSEDGTRPETT